MAGNEGHDEQESVTKAADEKESLSPVVGIGASAGGVDALSRFFEHIPEESGLSYVVILHLSPEHESNLSEVLQHSTSMPVRPVEDKVELEPNHVYVIPPKVQLTVHERKLRLTSPERTRPLATIDQFLRSLAEDQGKNAIGIVLSGTGTDGTLGLRTIKEYDGIAMVQDPSDAEYASMPRSAIASGIVDVVLPAGELAARLLSFRDSAGIIRLPIEEEPLPTDEENVLQRIFSQLQTGTGHDFSHYKRSTVMRRLERRMQVNEIKTLGNYLDFLREHPEEIQALFQDLLISVTSFFRDPEAFAALEEKVLPELFRDKERDDQIRAWVAGCATGEEAYSIAMLLHEWAGRTEYPLEVQIFATDVNASALDAARQGLYPETISADVPPERLKRYFAHEGNHYRVRKVIRELVLFAEHNLLQDPPFSKLDLISCRNLLIYLDRETQKSVFALLHYALNPDGYLFLGKSEAGGAADGHFSVVDKKHGILTPKRAPQLKEKQTAPLFTLPAVRSRSSERPDTSAARKRESTSDLHRRLLMEQVASVLVNQNFDIVHVSDRASEYLAHEAGEPTHNVLEKVPRAVRHKLRSALFHTFQGKQPTQRAIQTPLHGETRHLTMQVRPVEEAGSAGRLAQIVFREAEPPADRAAEETASETSPRVAQLEEELKRTRAQLQTTAEEYETATEEMETSNEELLSMNEELQSKNEELETSQEELQSVNEELKTTNQELKNKIEELSRSNSDLKNLMAATEIATLFLDRELRIKRYTPRATELFNITATDVGRHLSDFTRHVEYNQLPGDAERVLSELEAIEREVQSASERWYLVRLRPYRTVEDRITGVVITFVDITALKKATEQLRRERNFISAVLDTIGSLVVVLGPEGRIERFNQACERATGYTADEAEGENFLDLLVPPDERETVRSVFDGLRTGDLEKTYESHWVTKEDERRFITWSNTALRDETGGVQYVVSTGMDVTDRRELEQRLVQAEEDERRRIGQDLHDILASHLAGTAMMIRGLIQKMRAGEPLAEAHLEKLEEIGTLIREGADRARNLAHALVPVEIEEHGLGIALESLAAQQESMSGILCTAEIDPDASELDDKTASTHLYRIAQEAVHNAIRHANPQHVTIGLTEEEGRLVLTIRDDGRGIPDDVDPIDGLGLHMMKYRADLIGGTLTIEPDEEAGTTVRCSVPLPASATA